MQEYNPIKIIEAYSVEQRVLPWKQTLLMSQMIKNVAMYVDIQGG
jgi:hypothetical protein